MKNNMKKKILFIQFSNSMFIRHGACDSYWESFYKRWEEDGYYVGKEVFEIPKWIAEIAYFSGSYKQDILWCRYSVDEAIGKIKSDDYEYVLMSLMNANQHFIEDVVKNCPNQGFVIGGYNEKYLEHLGETYPNVIISACNQHKNY